MENLPKRGQIWVREERRFVIHGIQPIEGLEEGQVILYQRINDENAAEGNVRVWDIKNWSESEVWTRYVEPWWDDEDVEYV